MNSYGLVLIYTLAFVQALSLVQSLRRTPHGYFMGLRVEEGTARNWLRAYRLLLIALVVVMAWVALLAFHRKELISICAGASFCLCVLVQGAFGVTAWLKLAPRRPLRPVALSLESRRLCDYISWPVEVVTLAMIVASWLLLLRIRSTHADWWLPLQMTWGALVLPGKVQLVRAGFPVPSESAEEHYRFRDAMRRNNIRFMDAWGISFAVVLLEYALQHSLALQKGAVWIYLPATGLIILAYAWMFVVSFRNRRLSATVGRELLTSASFKSGFAGNSRIARLGLNQLSLSWFIIWIAGGFILTLIRLF